MVEFNKYSFKKYSNNYIKLFKREKARLNKALKGAEIEHVGSTAVPGLGGKGIVDIAIKTPKNKIKPYLTALERLGYEYNKVHPNDFRRIFVQKRILYKGKERRIHIHLTLNREFWDSFVVVRDYFLRHKEARDEYLRIKKEAIKYAKGDGKKYREYKNSFLEKTLKLALKERLKHN